MIGDKIKELRKQKGITQQQLASIIGVQRSSIGKYEGKNHIIPSDEVKIKIAEYFGVSLDYLCGANNDYDQQTVKNNQENPAQQMGRQELLSQIDIKFVNLPDDLKHEAMAYVAGRIASRKE